MKTLTALLLTVAVLWGSSDPTQAEKLSVLIPNQNTEFDLDHNIPLDVDIRASNLSPPLGVPPTPATPQLNLPAPPAPLPTARPGVNNNNLRTNLLPQAPINNFFQDPIPALNALYEVPDAETRPEPSQQCEDKTVVVTSRDIIYSTTVSVSQVYVPTTVIQRVTSTRLQYQTDYQTSYVTVQGPTQTLSRTVTRDVTVPQTVYVTSTSVRQQYVTTTRVQTQVVTSRVVEAQYVTVTQTATIPVVNTVYSTQLRPTYVTTTQTNYVTQTCPSTGYSYPDPSTTSGSYGTGSYNSGSYGAPAVVPGVNGYYGSSKGPGFYGPFYGPFHAHHVHGHAHTQPQTLIGKKKNFIRRLVGR